ncbi:DEAD/DEAH box helicase family protein [Fonticella tunisiensis]|uniref:Type III restriction enzyme n=1 Tax=Fonticella tunisiensis TaxID=1096341 RepID=A0A4R7KE09_9CLOT|nr:DEAD/DEAH box helicase family protein [Fonticella tunisiensis]TDT51283.1 type III restriction enzyme [Fonticella tunisiensis]
MPTGLNLETGNIPLKYAKRITELANHEWESGAFLEKVTPITQWLLKHWFTSPFTDNRSMNFHEGQKQAILNTIYIHEILKPQSAIETCKIIGEGFKEEEKIYKKLDDRFAYPKYAIKMATGTGKTWVMHALIVWQYLNAKFDTQNSGRYSKNFLLIAPGLIVYDRLLDAYLGKIKANSEQNELRDFDTSDIKINAELFIPDEYREEVLGFIQSSIVTKKDIGKKVTGDGMIAITNWHLLSLENEEKDEAKDDIYSIVNDVFPITPGKTANHSLETLDDRYLRGNEIEYLSSLSDIVVINDEAHHVHDNKNRGEKEEVKWQQSINVIAASKGNKFIQIDFSATPYNVTGSGQRRTKHYFPHIIVDYGLEEAIKTGKVKTIVIDKRKSISGQNLEALDFKAVREGKKVVSLSEGQKIMIRAGLQKLKILEKQFVSFSADKNGISNKHPKMLIMCEDTSVSPFVVDYLVKYEGLNEDEVVRIDSDSKGNVSDKVWSEVKEKLFNIDKYPKPKVIVSVLMLREGFDVNNICVIVPLRSTEAPILLEQTVGRGLRLMWRERQFDDIKAENRKKLLEEKKEPNSYLDILSIIEHPRFQEFYNDLINQGICGEGGEIPTDREKILGDLIRVPLKENYRDYDLYIPFIIKDKEEILENIKFNIDKMEPFTAFSLEQMKKFVKNKENTFYSEELTVKTVFGNYRVPPEVFSAQSYNEYIAKIVSAINRNVLKTGKHRSREFTYMQINTSEVARAIDKYIRIRLFNREFNPLEGDNWKVLLLTKYLIVEHIIREVNKLIYHQQNNIKTEEAVVLKKYLSDIDEMKMRKNYSIEVSKSIYKRLPYPSNKGEFEKDFILFCDRQAEVESFIKIKENITDFIDLTYIRDDGMIAHYYPDFIVKFKDEIYLVETKAEVNMNNRNVQSKKRAALEWVERVNALKPEDRMNCSWDYVLLSDKVFYEVKADGGSLKDILELAREVTGS